MNIENILIVCIGNICRSPMAEALLKRQYPDKNIFSAGLDGCIGYSADSKAIDCMSEIGLDISKHCARKLDSTMFVHADIVLAMTNRQVREIEAQWPFSKGKVFRLCHWSMKDIPDPYGKDMQVFMLTKNLILSGIDEWSLYF